MDCWIIIVRTTDYNVDEPRCVIAILPSPSAFWSTPKASKVHSRLRYTRRYCVVKSVIFLEKESTK
eukprot:scaffold22293_cov54-Cyclotella_meneghiniana.AAC.5